MSDLPWSELGLGLGPMDTAGVRVDHDLMPIHDLTHSEVHRALPLIGGVLLIVIACGSDSPPVALEISPRFVVVVHKDDHAGQFLLDTGSNATVIAQRVADDWGIVADPGRSVLTRGTSGQRSVNQQAPQVDGLRLGSLQLDPVDVTVMDFPEWMAVDGILGTDVIGRYVWHFNPSRGELQVHRYDRDWAPPADTARVSIENERNLPFVTLTLPDGRSVRALLDTGAEQTALPQPLVAGSELHDDAQAARDEDVRAAWEAIGVEPPTGLTGVTGGVVPYREAFLPQSWLGELEIGLLIVSTWQEDFALLGADVLSHRAWTLDFAGGQLWLGPRVTEESRLSHELWRESQRQQPSSDGD